MRKNVYIAWDENELIKRVLADNGFAIILGNGSLQREHLAQCEVLIPGKCSIDRDVLDQAPHLKLISKLRVGVEQIDLTSCSEKGIIVANTPLANLYSVAEHTFTLLLATAKRFKPIWRGLYNGETMGRTSARQKSEEKRLQSLDLVTLATKCANSAWLSECEL